MSKTPMTPPPGSSLAHDTQRLVAWLAEGALLTERMLNGLSPDVQAKVAAGITVGGEIELRVRLAANMPPRLQLHLVGSNGRDTIELVRA